MIPGKFEYHDPTALAEAIALLERHGEDAKVLAGDQSLIPMTPWWGYSVLQEKGAAE